MMIAYLVVSVTSVHPFSGCAVLFPRSASALLPILDACTVGLGSQLPVLKEKAPIGRVVKGGPSRSVRKAASWGFLVRVRARRLGRFSPERRLYVSTQNPVPDSCFLSTIFSYCV